MSTNELELQQKFTWSRTGVYETYNAILGRYQVQEALKYARGHSLLDAPCGDGALTEMMLSRFDRVVGIDASETHLALARDRLPNGEFHQTLLEEFDTEERFGTITMINVLEHVVDPIYALQRMARLLMPGGILIVHVPNALAINRRLAVKMGTLTECEELSPFDINVAGHRRSYSLKSLQDDVVQAGLRVVATGGVFYKMLSTPQMDWFLKNGPWETGGFGWGRVGAEQRDWRAEFCRACYEIGADHPEDCNIIYVCIEV